MRTNIAIQAVIQLPPRRKQRPEWMRRLGVRLCPQTVTEAWYDADCPRYYKPNARATVLLQWHVSRWLRGTR